MEETRTSGPKPQNKKIANHEWRAPSTRLCGTTLCTREGRKERRRWGYSHIKRGGMLVGNFKLNERRPIWAWTRLFLPLKE